ncbi:MAG: HAMP domain-containing sensor histidine kinase [Vampirovibrionales bacterium]|nr:HAMP domain-containing sensor histidine kinase [Vampirovibrionales bacterium]
MNKISLFKLSRYFFALFLLVTVLPLLGAFIWTRYEASRIETVRQKHFLNFVSNDMLRIFKQYLVSESRALDDATRYFSLDAMDETNRANLLKAKRAIPLESKTARDFFKRYPNSFVLKKKLASTQGDYILENKKLTAYFIVPSAEKTFLVIKEVPIQNLVPRGLFFIEIFANRSMMPGSRIQVLYPPLPPFPPDVAKHLGFNEISRGKEPIFFKHFSKKTDFPHPITSVQKKNIGQFVPEPLDSMLRTNQSQAIHLKNSQGQAILTLRINMLPFPPSPLEIQSGWVGVMIFLSGIVTCLLAGNYLEKNFILPLTRLSVSIQGVSEGNYSTMLDTSKIKQSDIRQTLENFNRMMADLREKEDLRNNFVSNLTHDLKTPLIAQARSLELLSGEFEILGLKDQENLAKSLFKNNEHLLGMINQLLETYQTDSGNLKLELQDINIPVVVNECFEQLNLLAKARSIKLRSFFEEGIPAISADSHYIKRVLINLIGNAIDNSSKNTTIDVTGKLLRRNPGSDKEKVFEIKVTDDGPGITEAEQKHLFDRYYSCQGDTRKLGAGLGLYICKTLVSAHHGEIFVESELGKGSAFIIHLPVIQKGGAA